MHSFDHHERYSKHENNRSVRDYAEIFAKSKKMLSKQFVKF